MGDTSIQWTNKTWNPIVGCKRVSPGCDHCYAFQLHDRRHIAWKRGHWPDTPVQYHQPFSHVQVLTRRINDPFRWRKPSMVFVNSMSDLFHEDVPEHIIRWIFQVMGATPQHTYQILTKRPKRMREVMMQFVEEGDFATTFGDTDPPFPWPNVWLGVSVENQAEANNRIPLLLETPAAVRFLSCEPLLEEVNLAVASVSAGLSLTGLQWVIIGGESGPRARPMDLAWIDPILSQCQALHIAPFVKQLGTVWAKEHGAKDRHGGNPIEWPEYLRVREFPPRKADAAI